MAHTRDVSANYTLYEEDENGNPIVDERGNKIARKGPDGKNAKETVTQAFDDFYGESDQDFKGCIRDFRSVVGDEGLAKMIWAEQYTNHANSIRPTSGGGQRGPSLMGRDTKDALKEANAAGLTPAEIQAAILAAAEAKRQ